MAIVNNTYCTITCNGPNCPNTVTFSQADEEKTLSALPWIKTLRVVQQVSDKRNFCYCSDSCELAAVAAGNHNPAERKIIIDAPASSAMIQQAAAQAKAQEDAVKKLKDGQPVTLHQG